MAVSIVRLGSPRAKKEGVRIGTVRRPPRGVRKTEYAARDWYDVWYPNLSPSSATLKLAHQATTPAEFRNFFRRFRREMAAPENVRSIALLAALSRHADFSLGCYCADESRCHRSVLRALLEKAGADIR